MGLYALGEYAKKLKKQQQPAMMFDSNLQQTTPDVGAGKPNKNRPHCLRMRTVSRILLMISLF